MTGIRQLNIGNLLLGKLPAGLGTPPTLNTSGADLAINSGIRLKGGLRIGDDSSACGATNKGTIKYQDADKKLYYCDGTDWKELGGGGTGTSTRKTAKVIAAGSRTTPAPFVNDDSLKCWGQNSFGQLGLGNTTTVRRSPKCKLGQRADALKAVALGYYHTCAIASDDSLKCWGWNIKGELGLGNTTQQNSPQNVSLGSGLTAKASALGYLHTCAIASDDSLKCWGFNDNGQLGLGNTANQNTPQNVSLGSGFSAKGIALGEKHSCAIASDNFLQCWGNNYYGQLGLAIEENTPITSITTRPSGIVNLD